MFQVVNRCFQILQSRTEDTWRAASDLVITPDVRGMEWDASIAAATAEGRRRGRKAALPEIQKWFPEHEPAVAGLMAGLPAAKTGGVTQRSRSLSPAKCGEDTVSAGPSLYARFNTCLIVPLLSPIFFCNIISA